MARNLHIFHKDTRYFTSSQGRQLFDTQPARDQVTKYWRKIFQRKDFQHLISQRKFIYQTRQDFDTQESIRSSKHPIIQALSPQIIQWVGARRMDRSKRSVGRR